MTKSEELLFRAFFCDRLVDVVWLVLFVCWGLVCLVVVLLLIFVLVSGEFHSDYFSGTVFFCLFFKTEFLRASSPTSQHKLVFVACYPHIAHQSQK